MLLIYIKFPVEFHRVDKMAQQVKASATKPNYLDLIPETHMVERETQPP